MSARFQICYITDRRAIEPRPILPLVLEAVWAGVDFVQIREKDMATRELTELVAAAVRAGRESGTGTRILVNDRLDVALAVGADGVHLGTRSMPAQVVRRMVPQNFLVGVSCHSLHEALEAESAGADYLLLGPTFETPSKLAYGPPLGLEKLREVTARVKTPVFALGGLSVNRVKACLEAGATGIAGIAVFQESPSLMERVRELRDQAL